MKSGAKNRAVPGTFELLPCHLALQVEPVDIRRPLMEAIVTGLADDIQDNEYGTGKADGQAGYIDDIESFVLADASNGNTNKIFPHVF